MHFAYSEMHIEKMMLWRIKGFKTGFGLKKKIYCKKSLENC